MKLIVFGATGGTGMRLLEQACAARHQVTAVVRAPAKLRWSHPDLTTVRADVMNAAEIEPIVRNADAVVSALGSRDGRAPTTVCSDGVSSIVSAMTATGTRRLVVVSAAGITSEGDGPLTRLLVKPILQRVLRNPFDDMRRMEDVVRACSLDWTIVRPPMLTDGPRTGTYRTTVNGAVRGGLRLSRADLADLVLRCLPDRATVTTTIAAGY